MGVSGVDVTVLGDYGRFGAVAGWVLISPTEITLA
jgi:hypothetical protein